MKMTSNELQLILYNIIKEWRELANRIDVEPNYMNSPLVPNNYYATQLRVCATELEQIVSKE